MACPLAVLMLAAPAAAQTVTANCDVPPAARDACDHWYTTPWVSLTWSTAPVGGMIVNGCANGLFAADSPRVSRPCQVRWGATTVATEVWIGIDTTPPTVSAVPARPPDHNGWFNHPVALGFQGADATSGVASCTGGTYAAPDGAGLSVAGTCTDVAGNVGGASLSLSYDATAPEAPAAELIPGENLVRLDWPAPRDAVTVSVVRLLPGADEVVYAGARRELVDRGLRNGVRARYRLTAVDRAGNRASSRESAVPTSAALLTPAPGESVSEPPLLAWRRVAKARYYNVQLFRGRRKLLTRWPRANRLQLERRWRFGGRTRVLKAGLYTWYVWPELDKRGDGEYGRMLGRQRFRVRPPAPSS